MVICLYAPMLQNIGFVLADNKQMFCSYLKVYKNQNVKHSTLEHLYCYEFCCAQQLL